MAENRFEDLVKDVTKQEKEDLLQKIQQNIEGSDPAVAVGSQPIKRNMDGASTLEMRMFALSSFKKLDIITKIIFKFRIAFQKKDLYSLIIEKKLDDIRRSIQLSGNYIDFDKNTVSAKFAGEVYALYLVCQPLRPVFSKDWGSSKILDHLVSATLSKGNANEKRTISDFISLEQMTSLYTKDCNQEDVRRAVLRSVKQSLDVIPESKFAGMKLDIAPLYAVKPLISYPFTEMFTLFGVKPQEIGNQRKPFFRASSIKILMDYLIKLNYAVTMAEDITLKQETAKILFNSFHESSSLDTKELKYQTDLKLRYLKEVQAVLADFNRKVPLLDIIRYYKQDPFFTVTLVHPKLDLKQFYTNAARLMVINTFPSAIQTVKLAYIDNSVRRIFAGTELIPLSYYTIFTDPDWERMKLPIYSHHKSLMITYNFLHYWCKVTLAPILMILTNTVLVKSSSMQSKSHDFGLAIDFFEDKIRRLDLSLSPETESGKTCASLRAGVKENTTQLRLLRSFLMQKDIEVSSLLKDITSLFDDFTRYTNAKVIQSGIESIKTSLASVYPSISRSRPFNDLLQEVLKEIDHFSTMIKELIEYEKSGVISS